MKKSAGKKELKPKVVSRTAWLKARKALLAQEKRLTHRREALNAARRKLPWVRVEKDYVFHGPEGRATLSDLFQGRSQLLVYHFMFGPTWEEGCPSCSFIGDHMDGPLPHLHARDVTLVAVSRAPYLKIQAFQKRMGWKFPWYSSFGNDFNFDFHVSFTPEEIAKGKVYYNYRSTTFRIEDAPGISAFYKDSRGEIFHTYSSYARGLETLLGTYNFLDLAPKGRDEDGLAFSMAWVRHHDRYGDDDAVDTKAGYRAPKGAVLAGKA
ncbi:MAG: DUF899 domain-containing protein [Roseovarius sp.]|nr:DUF899 domain-containing protein [Roseovarius sp.]